jgi:hypothetical protein
MRALAGARQRKRIDTPRTGKAFAISLPLPARGKKDGKIVAKSLIPSPGFAVLALLERSKAKRSRGLEKLRCSHWGYKREIVVFSPTAVRGYLFSEDGESKKHEDPDLPVSSAGCRFGCGGTLVIAVEAAS